MRLEANGDLLVSMPQGEVRFHKPVVYQPASGNGARTTDKDVVNGGFVLRGSGQVGFEVASYDRSKPVIIDPVLTYSTYLGGSDLDVGSGIAVDESGDVTGLAR